MSETYQDQERFDTATDQLFFVPSREWIQGLKVGRLAPNVYGQSATVTEIFAQSDDDKGRAFVCYYTDNGNGSTISSSAKEGKLQRTLRVTRDWNSAECDAIERRLQDKFDLVRKANCLCTCDRNGCIEMPDLNCCVHGSLELNSFLDR